MATAKETSPADKKLKVVHRIRLNELVLSVGDDRNFSIQRTYVYNGKVGYSNWLRLKDLEDTKQLLGSFAAWSEKHPAVPAPDHQK